MANTQNEKTRHDLDDEKLGQYLKQEIPDLKLPVISTKIGYGQSNPTYFVDDAAKTRYILRKKPSGTIISPVAHQVDREYKVLKALGTIEGFPVPKVYCLCMDADIIGTAFYVMEFVRGRIITDPNLSTLPVQDRRLAWKSVISTLAWLHSIDPDAIGLSSFGKKENFYKRHCSTFSRIEAQQAQVRDVKTGQVLGRAHAHFDEIVDYVRRHAPEERSSIVHGDYKFDNIVLHPTEPRVVAILDWELSTLGHPLMDVVYAVGPYWNRASKSGISGGAVKARDDQGDEVYDERNLEANGLPSMEELLDVYTQRAGWDPRCDKWEVAKIFHLMRASSEFSHVYFENTKRGLDEALRMVREMKERDAPKSSL
ncbi:phosphotransferase enzyme family domain protein [Stemphylium lycopersici]|nr:phosphotransferase enzyme family domain protein [Stemphylium lycopersici]RAR08602.1 phosphotransferase enzyme family domain protein [Stemphylium lycopersici]